MGRWTDQTACPRANVPGATRWPQPANFCWKRHPTKKNIDDTLIAVLLKRPNVGAMIEEIAVLLLIKKIDIFVKREKNYHQNKEKMYSVMLGQCTEAMKNLLEVESTY